MIKNDRMSFIVKPKNIAKEGNREYNIRTFKISQKEKHIGKHDQIL